MKGIRRTPTGWQAYIRVRGRLYSKRFPPDTTIERMKTWRKQKDASLRFGSTVTAPATTLAEDVRNYLTQVRTMPTYDWRKADLDLWLKALGHDRDRRSLTSHEIRSQLEQWRTDGYAANTVNHRRTALMHLFTVLDGKTAPNPARDVPRYSPERGRPRALSPQAVELLLRAMPESQTKARLEVMAWTGWPHAQLMKVTPADVNWKQAVYVRPRRKGKGAAGAWLPLLPQAWRALRTFKRLGCWGEFSTSSMRKSLRLAAEKVRQQKNVSKTIKAELENVTPYQFRHSFGTLMALLTQDDRAVQALMQHSDVRTTHLYTEASVDPRVLAAIQKVAKQLSRRT